MDNHEHRKDDLGQLCRTGEAGGSKDQFPINDYLLRPMADTEVQAKNGQISG